MTRRIYVVLAMALLLSGAGPVLAQQTPDVDPASQLALKIQQRASEIAKAKQDRLANKVLTPEQTPRSTINVQVDFEPIGLALVQSVSRSALAVLEQRRADKQIGEASGSTAGSTSLATKGGTPAILAIAVENGALTQEVSGTTVTFRGTPVGIVQALRNNRYFDIPETSDAAVAVLKKFSFAASFDASRGVAEGATPTFTGDRGQFAGASVRVSAVDHKDPRAAVNDARWRTFATSLANVDVAALSAFNALREDPQIVDWVAETNRILDDVDPDQVLEVLMERFRALQRVEIRPETRAAVAKSNQQFADLLNRRAQVLSDIAGGAQVVFDWSFQRPASGLDSSNFKVVGSIGRSVILTGNGAVTFYHGTLPAGTERLRDVQVAAQLDVPFGDAETIGRYVLSWAFKVQHMPNDVVAPEGALFPGTKGTIWLGQTKITIPIKGTAAKIPLSVTLANRTELIAEKKVFARANVGVSYDLDAVLARFKP